METTYRILIMLTIGLCVSTSHSIAQSETKYARSSDNESSNWTDMSKGKESYFVNKALELIKEYGPGYYRPNARFDIAENEYMQDGEYESVLQNNGRKYYIVGFFYDTQEEWFKDIFVASVRFWKDTEEPWNITFGNGKKILFLTEPYKASKKKHEIVPFELDTLKMKRMERFMQRSRLKTEAK